MAATGALSRAGGIASHAWFWWWEESNRRDEFARAALTLLLITTAAASSYLAWRKKKRNRSLPPGPTGLPLVGSLPFLGRNLHHSFADLAKAYGPVMSVRLGARRCVVVSSPAAAKEVLHDHDAVFAYRDPPAVVAVYTYGKRDIGWNNDPASWRLLRKVCERGLLNSSSLDAFYPLRRGELRRAVRELYGRLGTPVRVREVSFLTFLDMIMSVLWGGTLEEGEMIEVRKEFPRVVQGIMDLLGEVNVSDLFPLVARFDLQGVGRRMKRLMGSCDDILSRIIDVRLRACEEGGSSGASGVMDFLKVMVDAMRKNATETPFTVDDVKATLLDIVAGATETSTTVEWAMAELIHSQEIMRRTQEELDAVVGRDAVVEESHIPRLRYLAAVVKETLRLHPVIPLLIPRRPSEPRVVGGHRIPSGTMVFVNAWMIHREPSNWEDPLEFKPERFLQGGTRWDYHGGGDFRFLPFGSGRRICAGITMAERMMMFLLATFLHSFEWQLPAAAEVDFTETVDVVLKMAKPLCAVPTPRLSAVQLYE